MVRLIPQLVPNLPQSAINLAFASASCMRQNYAIFLNFQNLLKDNGVGCRGTSEGEWRRSWGAGVHFFLPGTEAFAWSDDQRKIDAAVRHPGFGKQVCPIIDAQQQGACLERASHPYPAIRRH